MGVELARDGVAHDELEAYVIHLLRSIAEVERTYDYMVFVTGMTDEFLGKLKNRSI